MPGMDCLELQCLLANANHRIPIIFVTAQASDDEQRRATQAGCGGLRKPVSGQALISAIRAVSRRGRPCFQVLTEIGSGAFTRRYRGSG